MNAARSSPGFLRSFALAIALVGLIACRSKGEKAFGQPCAGNAECKSGLCVAAGAQGATCTKSCASGDDCPRGHSCSAVTEDRVLVCAPGNATPFGQ